MKVNKSFEELNEALSFIFTKLKNAEVQGFASPNVVLLVNSSSVVSLVNSRVVPLVNLNVVFPSVICHQSTPQVLCNQ